MLSFCLFFCLINYCQLLQVRPHLPPNLLGKGNYFDEDYDCDGEYNDYGDDDSCDDEYDYMIMVVMIMKMVDAGAQRGQRLSHLQTRHPYLADEILRRGIFMRIMEILAEYNNMCGTKHRKNCETALSKV